MKIFCIGDIHFGKRKNTESLYNELKNSFLNKIKENGADLVVLLGDMTDTKLQLNSEAAMYYNRFMDDLHRLALEFNFLIFCINGTFSHERNQLKAFSHFFNFNIHIFIICILIYIMTIIIYCVWLSVAIYYITEIILMQRVIARY